MADNNEHFCGPRTDADNVTKNVSDMDKLLKSKREQQM